MPVDVGEREGMGNEMSRGRYGDGGRIEEKGKRGRLNPHAYTDKREVREGVREEPIPGTHNSKESQAPKKGDDTKGDLHNAKSLLNEGETSFSSLTASSSYSSPLSTLAHFPHSTPPHPPRHRPA